MRLLITGGAGFIGSCFIRHILNKYPGYQIINLDLLTYCGNLDNLSDIKNNPDYKFVKGDIRDKNLVKNISLHTDCIINFAAESHVDNSIKNPEIFIETNVLGTLNLLQVANETGIKKFIQISTDEVYGSLDKGYFHETTPLAPNSPYSVSKASADMLAMAYYKTFNLPVIITRCSNNYGEYQYPEKLIPFFISKLLKNEKVPLYGNGSNVRDWIYVYDHCEAIDIVLHKGKIGEIYNIGSHNEKSNIEIAKFIINTMGKDDSYINYVADRLGHDKRYAISNDKIKKQLNWQPKVDFETGLKHTIKWYLNNQKWIKNIENKKKNAKALV